VFAKVKHEKNLVPFAVDSRCKSHLAVKSFVGPFTEALLNKPLLARELLKAFKVVLLALMNAKDGQDQQ